MPVADQPALQMNKDSRPDNPSVSSAFIQSSISLAEPQHSVASSNPIAGASNPMEGAAGPMDAIIAPSLRICEPILVQFAGVSMASITTFTYFVQQHTYLTIDN